MTDYQRARLRTGFESVLRIMAGVSPTFAVNTAEPHTAYISVVGDSPPPDAPLPELTTAQQLALSVLLGDESVIPQFLADFLLDQGHEYATAVAEKARAEERETVAGILWRSRRLSPFDCKAYLGVYPEGYGDRP